MTRPHEPEPRLNRELTRLIATQVCIHACMAGMRLAAPLQALQQGHSAAAVGFLLALFALTQVFLAMPAGRFADRHGLRLPLRYCVAAGFSSGMLALAFPIFPVLCLSALLSGGATGAAVIALQRHVGRAAESQIALKQAFSWLAIGPALSNFLGPFIAGLLIDHFSYRASFAFSGLVPLAAWWFSRGVKDLPPVVPQPGQSSRGAWDLLREPMFRRLMITNWCVSTCWDVHTFVLPIMGHERGYSASVIGTILGAFAVAATIIRLLIPMLAAWLRETTVITSAMVIAGLIYIVYPLLPNPWLMGAFSVLLGFALGSVQPMAMSALHQITPEARHGEALGLRLALINASSVGMPLLFGGLGAVVGVSLVFWCSAGVVLAGSRLAWRGLTHSDAGEPGPPHHP